MSIRDYLPDKEKTLLHRLLKDNADAIDMVSYLLEITHIWDDLIDKDKPVTDGKINQAFIAALIELPRNSFWREHHDQLSIVLEHAIIDWATANTFEKEQRLVPAYILRCSVASVIIHAARIIAGGHWALTVSEELRREIFDDFEQYEKEHKREI